MNRNKERELKIKELFERELKQNPNKMKEYLVNENSKDFIKLQQFLFPRIILEKHIQNTHVIYSMYEINSPIYFPLEEKYIDLCLEHDIMTISRTLRIFKKKKALKRITKQKVKPEGWEEKVEQLVNSIEKIYGSGNTINLNLLR